MLLRGRCGGAAVRRLGARSQQASRLCYAYMSSDFEDIGKIGGEGELQRHSRIEVAEVCET